MNAAAEIKPAPLRWSDAFVLVLGLVFAAYLRYNLRHFESYDFMEHTSRWFAALKANGLAATDVANYTPPYLYLLYLTSLVTGSMEAVTAIKIPAVLFDFVCAGLVFLIVRLRYADFRVPMLAFLAVLLAPTVVSNSALWGQADSIYVSLLLATVYCLLVKRPVLAMLALSIAFAFKAQAVFLAPLVGALLLRGLIPFWTVALIPATYAVAMIPAWLAGRPAADLATIYLSQGQTYQSLSKNAPNLYLWLPDGHYQLIVLLGAVLAAVVAGVYVWALLRRRPQLDQALLLKLSLLSLMIMPFFLPKMHERYFFPADVLSIAYGFYFPRQYGIPVAITFASFFAYQPFLFFSNFVPLGVAALVMAIALALLVHSTWQDLRVAAATAR